MNDFLQQLLVEVDELLFDFVLREMHKNKGKRSKAREDQSALECNQKKRMGNRVDDKKNSQREMRI